MRIDNIRGNIKGISQTLKPNIKFNGGLARPLNNDDYKRAKEYIDNYTQDNDTIYDIRTINCEKINGIQKDIKVFKGLSMKDIELILKGPILINRGCNNLCVHCGYQAMPYSNDTFDRMSWEDFSSLISGIEELEKRMNNKVVVSKDIGTNLFLDSDCIDIELKDKQGNIYDYVDCINKLKSIITDAQVYYDTSGWNPDSTKHQKRAEKLVNYILSNDNRIDCLYLSLNPYHSLFANSCEFRTPFQLKHGKQQREKYYRRIANAMFMFTPLIKAQDKNFEFCFLTRAISSFNSTSLLNKNMLIVIKKEVIKELAKLYKQDLDTEQKYVHDKKEIKELIKQYKKLIKGVDQINAMESIGRAESLFRYPKDTQKEREEKTLKKLITRKRTPSFAINPNGSVIVISGDISSRTDLTLNFENKDKKVKPFAKEIENFTYIV